MTNQRHPITPPPELVQQWAAQRKYLSDQVVFSEITQWVADQVMEACCEWLNRQGRFVISKELRAALRPKPPSLKEQALDEIDRIPTHDSEGRSVGVDVSIIRRALEQLDD